MKALLIEFDLETGKRAGGINPKDPKLPCRGWQNLEVVPALEIRLVEDDRDLSNLKDVKGITILEDKEAINNAIDTYIPSQFLLQSEFFMYEHMKEKGTPLDAFKGMNKTEIAREAHKLGLAGVYERKPQKVK